MTDHPPLPPIAQGFRSGSSEVKPSKKFGIHFGALCPPIKDQLKKQGVRYSPTALKGVQEASDRATYLQIAGYLTDGELAKVRRRIMKTIEKAAGYRP